MKIEISGPVLYGLFKYIAISKYTDNSCKAIMFHDGHAYVTNKYSCIREEVTSDSKGFLVMMVPNKVNLPQLKKAKIITIRFNDGTASFSCDGINLTFDYRDNPIFNVQAVFGKMPQSSGAFDGFNFEELKRIVESRPVKDTTVKFKTDYYGGPLYNYSETRVEVIMPLRSK